MARKLKSDKVLFLTVLFLVCVSAIMVSSASAASALHRNWDVTRFLFKQVTWVMVGVLLMAGAMRVHYRAWQQSFVIWSFLAVVFTALVLVLFVGPQINGSRRWFGVGGIGVQPSEFAKLALVLFVADRLARKMERVNERATVVLPVGIVGGGLAGLVVLQPDLGTAIFLVIVTGVLILAAGLSYRYVFVISAIVMPAVAVLIATSDYRMERVRTWLDPWRDPLGDGFQIIQSFIAVGTGGLIGRGFMQGQQKIGFLPEPQSDFIFSVIAEEFGLLGATVVLAAFLVIAWRGYLIASHMPDRYGAFLALGLTALIAVQAFINISVVLGILPNKGLPLPFVSAGGSSMLASLLGVGILLNLSQHVQGSFEAVDEARRG